MHQTAAEPHFVTGRRLIGHEAARRVLWGALDRDAPAGSYLLKGPTGVGKSTVARAYAQAAACVEPINDPFGACEKCLSCKMAARGDHPEIIAIAPAGDQTQIWQFWDRPGKPPGALEHTLQFSPSVGRRRVYIIERADTLNDAASNSLLKVLEEPPAYAVFVLLTPNADRLLQTIVSRCQAISLAPMPAAELEDILADRYGLPLERARLFAGVAEGRIGDACRLAGDPSAFDRLVEAFDLAVRLGHSPPIRALRLSEEIRGLASQLEVPASETDVMPSGNAGVSAASPSDGDDRSQSTRGRTDRRQAALAIELLIFAYREMLAAALGSESSGFLTSRPTDARAEVGRLDPRRCLVALDVLIGARRRLDQNVSPNLLTDWIATTIAATTA